MAEILLGGLFLFIMYLIINREKEKQEFEEEKRQINEHNLSLDVDGKIFKVHYHPQNSIFVDRLQQIMVESNEIIRNSKNFETISSRMELIKGKIEDLREYAIDNDEVNHLKRAIFIMLKNTVVIRLNIVINEAIIKSKNAKTKRGKISPIEKIKTQIELHQEIIPSLSQIKINDALEYYMDLIEAEDLYDKYKKFEFKGNQKKADEYKKDLEYFLSKAHQDLRNIYVDKENVFSNLEVKTISL